MTRQAGDNQHYKCINSAEQSHRLSISLPCSLTFTMQGSVIPPLCVYHHLFLHSPHRYCPDNKCTPTQMIVHKLYAHISLAACLCSLLKHTDGLLSTIKFIMSHLAGERHARSSKYCPFLNTLPRVEKTLQNRLKYGNLL